MKLTVLCENTVRRAGLLAEHGLAWWLDTGTHRLLFDTGQGMVLQQNARKLGIPLESADAVVLSHGHYAHVGGLSAVLAAAPQAELWMHPAATAPKFTRTPAGLSRRISTSFMERGDFGPGRMVRFVTSPTEVVPGVWVTGQIPRTNSFEDVGGPFYLDETLTEPDPILDDMALFLPKGPSVVFGCAHAGAVNTLEWIRLHTGTDKFDSLFGGLHLLVASEERMRLTLSALAAFTPAVMAFGHCTGRGALHEISTHFGNIAVDLSVGREFEV